MLKVHFFKEKHLKTNILQSYKVEDMKLLSKKRIITSNKIKHV